MAEESNFNLQRTWEAIDVLAECVDEEADNEDENYHMRVHRAAMTVVGLGLGIDCLGELAQHIIEMETIAQADAEVAEDDGDDDEILDAREIMERIKSLAEKQW